VGVRHICHHCRGSEGSSGGSVWLFETHTLPFCFSTIAIERRAALDVCGSVRATHMQYSCTAYHSAGTVLHAVQLTVQL
jgi:hypothetical protein